jgi:hypothetical protein
MLHWMFLSYKELEFFVKIFQPQQRAYALVERVFVDDQSDIPFIVSGEESRDSEPSDAKLQTLR